MSAYPPPVEELPIFNPAVFIVKDTPLTIAEGEKYFLKYPQAQGTQNFTDINVGGIATIEDVRADTLEVAGNADLNGNLDVSGAITGQTITDIDTRLDIIEAELGTGVVHIADTETITGDKTLSGTTTFTGDIIANGATITPTELGYIDGATSNIQTQINDIKTGTPGDNIVHINGDETITGVKTFDALPLTALTPSLDNHLTRKKYVDDEIDTAINGLIDGAPATLDTLNELANALDDDPNFATTITTLIGTKANDTAVVHKTGNETIGGIKTFTSGIVAGGGISGGELEIIGDDLVLLGADQTFIEASVGDLRIQTTAGDGLTKSVKIGMEDAEIASFKSGDIQLKQNTTITGNLVSSGTNASITATSNVGVAGEVLTLTSGTTGNGTRLQMTDNLVKIGLSEFPDNLEVIGEVICATAPTGNDRLANKLYVDGEITDAVGTKVSKSGDTMTGDLTISKSSPSTENAQIIILCNGASGGGSPDLYSQVYLGEGLTNGAYYRYGESSNIITLGANDDGTEIPMISWGGDGTNFTIHKDTDITGDLSVGGNLTADNTFISNWGQTTSPQTGFYASFSHTAVSSTDADVRQKYALMQSNSGYTYLNSNSFGIDFRNNHSPVGVWDATKLEVKGNVSADGDLIVKGGSADTLQTTWNADISQFEVVYPTGTGLFFNNALSSPSLRLLDTKVQAYNGLEVINGSLKVETINPLNNNITISTTAGGINITANGSQGVGGNSADITLTADDDVILTATDDVFIYAGDSIEIDGNVKINNNTTGNSVSVKGDLNIEDGNIKIFNDSANICRITMDEALNESNIVMEYNGLGTGAANYFALYSGVSGWVGLGGGFNYIPSNGKVGIGLTNPSEKLEVNGNAIINGSVKGDYAMMSSAFTNYATFSHKDVSSLGSKYAILQASSGYTFLNSSSTLDFRINHGGVGTWNTTRLRCNNNLEVGGNAIIGGDLTIDSPVRTDLDMKMVCGSAISGITENKIYLKSGDDDGGATYLQYQDGTSAVEGVEIYVKDTASSPNRVAQFQEDLIVLEKNVYCSGDINVDDISVRGSINMNTIPLITQVHSFIQTDLNALNKQKWFSHSPHYDANTSNPVFGMKAVGNIVPYSLVIGTDNDAEALTNFTFEIRGRNNTDNIANLTTSTTVLKGTAYMNSVKENDTKQILISSPQTILNDTSWGLYLSNMNPDGYDGEIVVKVFFYQT